MFSPVKAITAGALVFALGGLFLVTQPFDQQGSVPGAEQGTNPSEPVVVTGTIVRGGYSALGTETFDAAGVSRSIGNQGNFYYEASDPRIDGMVTFTRNTLSHEPPTGDIGGVFVDATTRVLVHDNGRWVGTDTGLLLPDGTDMNFIVWHGEDAYAGLTAIIWEDWEGDEPYTFVGTIVAGMPPYPEVPAE